MLDQQHISSEAGKSFGHPFSQHEDALKSLFQIHVYPNPFTSIVAEDRAIQALYDTAILSSSKFCRLLGFQPFQERGTEAVHEWFCELRPYAARLYDPRRRFFPYAYTVLWFVTLAATRREGRRSCRPLEIDPPDELNDPFHRAALSEIEDAVHKLPDTLLDAISLRYYVGLSSKEAARRLDITPGAVDSRVHRGLNMLKHRWHDSDV